MYVMHAMQGFVQGMQRSQRTQEVTNNMAGICHVIWLLDLVLLV